MPNTAALAYSAGAPRRAHRPQAGYLLVTSIPESADIRATKLAKSGKIGRTAGGKT